MALTSRNCPNQILLYIHVQNVNSSLSLIACVQLCTFYLEYKLQCHQPHEENDEFLGYDFIEFINLEIRMADLSLFPIDTLLPPFASRQAIFHLDYLSLKVNFSVYFIRSSFTAGPCLLEHVFCNKVP